MKRCPYYSKDETKPEETETGLDKTRIDRNEGDMVLYAEVLDKLGQLSDRGLWGLLTFLTALIENYPS